MLWNDKNYWKSKRIEKLLWATQILEIMHDILLKIVTSILVSWSVTLLFFILFFNVYLGLGDAAGGDSQHISEMVHTLKQLEYMNVFCLVFNSQYPRLDESMMATVDIFTQIFGTERFFQNVVLVFTRWEHSDRADSKRLETGTHGRIWVYISCILYSICTPLEIQHLLRKTEVLHRVQVQLLKLQHILISMISVECQSFLCPGLGTPRWH